MFPLCDWTKLNDECNEESFCLINSDRKVYYDENCAEEVNKINFGQYIELNKFDRNYPIEVEIENTCNNFYCNGYTSEDNDDHNNNHNDITATIYSNEMWDLGYFTDLKYPEGDSKYPDFNTTVCILTDKENKEYIITGIHGCHPFIITPDFSYFNSEGSCVEYEYYLFELGSSPKVTEIFATMWLFLHDFAQNRYH